MAALVAYCVSLLARTFRVSLTPARHFVDGIQPFIKHKTLCQEDIIDKDILVVGDVHGCYDEAMELLQTVKSQNQRKFLTIFVGDMVNKGPKNKEMLEFLMKSREDVHCIRGNHEQAVLKHYFKLKNGGTVDPKWRNPWFLDLNTEQFEFIRNLPYTISIPILNMIVVHGGLVPSKPLHLQNDHDMIHMRGMVWVKDAFHGKVMVPTEKHTGDMWAECWPGPEHVYFGHDAIKKLQILVHTTGLDSGCLYGNELTGVLLRIPKNLTEPIDHCSIEREFYSVKAKDKYVPVD